MARSGTAIVIKKRDWTYTDIYSFDSPGDSIQTLLDSPIATNNWVTEVSVTEGWEALDHSLTLESLWFYDSTTYTVYDVTPIQAPIYIHNTRIRR